MENNIAAAPRGIGLQQVRLLELMIAALGIQYFPGLIRGLGQITGMPVPEMPLIGHAWLHFTFTMLIIAWMVWRRTPFAEIGLKRPPSWLKTVGQGVLIFVLVIVSGAVIRPLVDPWIAHVTGTSPTMAEQHFASLKGNLPMLLYLIPFAWLFGGLAEEISFRGFAMTRLGQLLGEGRAAWIVAVLLQAVLFAFGHLYQGPAGMFGVFMAGAITGFGVLLCGRNLWPAIIAHGLQDTLGFAALYTGIAHA